MEKTYESNLDRENINFNSNDISDITSLYFHEATITPLLTKEQEIELFNQVEAGVQARKELFSEDIFTKRQKEIKALITKGLRAREHIIRANSRLVISVANPSILTD